METDAPLEKLLPMLAFSVVLELSLNPPDGTPPVNVSVFVGPEMLRVPDAAVTSAE
ncbi:MAG: hypothetical protein KIT63_04545 [Rhodoferax sp.]|nr:hypothetical protein [Rhodoferax sp.]